MADASLTGAVRPAHGPLVVAHRGAWGDAPQNSIAAFEQAIADGADAVELDVRRSADNRLVVVHDPRIGIHPVSRLDHIALRERMAPGQAPELGEVLRVLAGRILVDVELKEDGYVAHVMDAVAHHLDPDGYVVTSFLDGVLPQVRAAVPRVRTGLLLTARRPGQLLERRITAAEPDFIAPHAALSRTGLLDWAARQGLPAWVWTVNDRRMLRLFLDDARVEAVITDRPRDALREAGRLDGPDVPAAA